jgi:hypothetical protein
MVERVSFLTSVLTSSQGAEQRLSLRSTPRRTFEADFLLRGPERTFCDLFMNRLGGGEVTVPLHWETVTLAQPLTATVSDRIDFDTRLREWQYHEGKLAILTGKDARFYEVVEIASVDDEGVTLAAPVTRPWPLGTKLLPLRRAVIDQFGNMAHKTAGVATVSAQFRLVGANPWEPAADPSPTYAGLPVFLEEPNWVDDLDATLDRDVQLLDTGIGLTYQTDPLLRALMGQAHRWFLPGKERLAAFRDLIYRHRGRQGAFWLPTFKADLRLVNSPPSASSQITVENVGYGYTQGPQSGRNYIAIKHSTGTLIRRIVSVSPGLTDATERLNLDAPLGLALSPGLVQRISFVDAARFDTDDFEIVHYGGVDAHHESGALFRTFKNVRSAPLPISFPVQTAAMDEDACGTPPWYVRIQVQWRDYGLSLPTLGFIIDPDDGPSIDRTDDESADFYFVMPPEDEVTARNPPQFFEAVWTSQDLEPQGFTLQMQFANTSLGPYPNAQARVRYRRFGDSAYRIIYPKAGSHSMSPLVGGYFTLGEIFPLRWFFDLP